MFIIKIYRFKSLSSTDNHKPINKVSGKTHLTLHIEKISCLFKCCTTVPIIQKLHVKIDNQAFVFIHVVKQVQLLPQSQKS